MVRLSLAVAAAALAPLAVAQEATPSALPDVTGPAGMACGGCYVVADVAGVLFGSVATQTQTNVVVTGNGTQALVTLAPMSTSVVEGQGKATFTNGEPEGPGIVTASMPLGSVVTVNGATLTSPTMYEVFTAYSVMSTVSGPSGCSVSSGTPSVLPTASKYPVPANAGNDYLLSLEKSFIQAVGFPECSAGGSNVQSTVHSQVTTTTTSITTNSSPTAVPAAATTAAASSTSSSASASASAPSASATYIVPNVSINPAFPSITPATAGGERAATWGSAAALVVALGVLAVWL